MDGSDTPRDVANGEGSTEPHEPPSARDDVQRIKAMPKEVGVLLLVAGLGGLVFPGPFGTPFLIMGGVILWPKAFEKLETLMARKFPKVHHDGVQVIVRFVKDLERRYPAA